MTVPSAPMETLAQALRRAGLEAGLDAVGVTHAGPFEEARHAIEERQASGMSAGMAFIYRKPATATDPRTALPGAAALVVGARSYLHRPPLHRPPLHRPPLSSEPAGAPEPSRPPGLPMADRRDRPAGRVARYSWVDEYRPLRAALGAVADRLRAEGWRARVLADDNALVDRAAAVRAGLGWYGKNANVLLAGAGSWFVLGSVVTDAPLPPDAPAEGGCGSCDRCRPACPTGALVAPGVLDARRCLAWLVQAPGVFPRHYRAALGDRLYGCDDCQEVCPVNRLGARRHPPPPAGADAEDTVDVLELLAADDATLLDRWGRWYIPRREPRYLRRNALLVLANTASGREPAVVEALRGALGSDDPLVAAHAVWAAARLGRSDLLDQVAAPEDPLVADELAHAADVEARPIGSGASHPRRAPG